MLDIVFRDEVRQILRGLRDKLRAVSVAIVHMPEKPAPAEDGPTAIADSTGAASIGAESIGAARIGAAIEPADTEPNTPAGSVVKRTALGHRSYLMIAQPATSARPDGDGDASPGDGAGSPGAGKPHRHLSAVGPTPRRPNRDAEQIERAVRALRACQRRWDAARLPALTVTPHAGHGAASHDRALVRQRIEDFLQALGNMQHAQGVLLTVRGALVASSGAPSELERERVPFLLRRIDAETERHSDRSHTDMVGEDVYVVSFWYGACLLVFFSQSYAVDFIRHRARLVCRELAQMLPLLDDPPPAPAQTAPVPD